MRMGKVVSDARRVKKTVNRSRGFKRTARAFGNRAAQLHLTRIA
jgi:hypothetical protein